MAATPEVDNIDLKILSLLMEDANMPYTEVAKRVFVSGGTVHVRMKKLEEMGIVQGAQLKIDYSKLGYDISAFIGIYLERSSLYEDVVKQLADIREIVDIHYTTGMYSIFAKLVCRDTNNLRQILHEKVQKLEGVSRTETYISLDHRLERSIDLEVDQKPV